MEPEIIFITGTDTGVGKTIVTSLLLAHLRQTGVKAFGLKPFCSGSRADAELLQYVQGKELTLDEVNPFYFPEPVTPLLAARKNHRAVSLKEVINHIEKTARHLSAEPKNPSTSTGKQIGSRSFLLIEGAGGLLSPLGGISEEKTVQKARKNSTGKGSYSAADLIQALQCKVIIVAANRLGTINHSILTVNCIQTIGLKDVTLVMNEVPTIVENSSDRGKILMADRDQSRATNAKLLREILNPLPVFELRQVGDVSESLGFTERSKRLKKICKKFQKTLANILE